ncbi:UNVERIFIED_CONTAM: hypothetical protein Sradi_5228000 [Sesamum radiatum]|uniref:RNase H type-1 domain-containing protein n=1 Tax=Sesamum radiatum TaxID=300843 RepID=A0AAW2LKA9_SESRA
MYEDSQLVINQLLGLYEVKKPELLPCHNYAKRLMGWLGDVELEHRPRRDNKQADALAKLVSTLSITEKEVRIPIYKSWIIPPIFSDDEDDIFQEEENHIMEVFEVEEEVWRQPLDDYFKYGKLPTDPRRRTDIRRWAIRFINYKDTLYKRSYEGIFLRCLSDEENVQAMEEAHYGVCGAQQSGPKLHFRIKRMSYYWPTMVKDCMDYARRFYWKKWLASQSVIGMRELEKLYGHIGPLIAIQEGFPEEENARIRLEELEALDEKRLEAQQRLECYQVRLSKAFNKKVSPCSFQVGDLVLAVRRPIITTHPTGNKFWSKWDDPYVVEEAYTNDAYKLVAEDGLRIDPINGKFLKRYYA